MSPLRLTLAARLVAISITVTACGSDRLSTGDQAGDPETESAPAPLSDSGPAAEASDLASITCEVLHDRILLVPPTRQTVAAEFGTPDSVIASAEPNRHVPDAVDSLFTVFYPGLTMSLRTPRGARDMATAVTIVDNRYLAYPHIGIHAPVERLVEVLGEPARREDDLLLYDCGTAVEQPVAFRIEDGRVTRIDISYYVD